MSDYGYYLRGGRTRFEISSCHFVEKSCFFASVIFYFIFSFINIVRNHYKPNANCRKIIIFQNGTVNKNLIDNPVHINPKASRPVIEPPWPILPERQSQHDQDGKWPWSFPVLHPLYHNIKILFIGTCYTTISLCTLCTYWRYF